MWCAGTHPAPAPPHFPQQHPCFHGAAADPVANSGAQHCLPLALLHHFPGFKPHPVPWLCQEGKQPHAANPDSTRGDFKCRTNSNKAQWRQERNHQLYLLPGAAHMAERNDQKVAKHFIFPPKQRRSGHSQEHQCKIPSGNGLQHSTGS